MEFVLLKMIVKNFDNKQSFLFSEVSRASQEEKAKKMLTRRAERWEWGAHTKGSLPFMLSNLRLPRAPIYSFFRFFFFFFSRVTDFAKKKALLLSWVEFCGSSIVSFRCRVQEQLLFQRLMACHSLPKERLDHPVILNERYTCTFIHVFFFFFFFWHWIDRLSIKCLCILDYFGFEISYL